MRIDKITLKVFLGLFVFCLQANAQISTREFPVGFEHNFSREQKSEIVMPAIDVIKLQAEDKKEEELGLPPRFGFAHSVNINLLDAGYWHTLMALIATVLMIIFAITNKKTNQLKEN